MAKRRVCAYCRVSTDSNDQKNSFENQKRYFERLICNKPEYEFVRIYADSGLSGTKIYRPEFDKMLQDAGLKRVVDKDTGKAIDAYTIVGKPTIDLIYVKDISRFARNVSADALLKTLAKNKVYIVYVASDGVEHSSETIDGIPFMQGALQTAEFGSRDISSKVRFGMKEGALNGNIFVGKQFYGYNYLPHPENKLEIIHSEAEVVRLIYKLYLDGIGSERICRKLGELGIFTRKGKRFTSTAILAILKNEKYTGMNDGMKYHTGELFGNRRLQHIPKEKQYRFKTEKIPAIIDIVTFEKAQEIRQSNLSSETKKGQYFGKTDFAGLVICGLCGCSYQACGTSQTKTKLTRYYACRHRYRYDTEHGIPKCENPTVTQEMLDELLTSGVYSAKRWFRIRDGLQELKEIRKELERSINRDNEAEIKESEKLLQETENKKEKLLDSYLDAVFSKEQLAKRMQPLEIMAAEIKAKINALSKTNEDIFRDIAEIDDLIVTFEEENRSFQDGFNNGTVLNKYSRKELLDDVYAILVAPDGSLTMQFKSLGIIQDLMRKYRYLLEQVS